MRSNCHDSCAFCKNRDSLEQVCKPDASGLYQIGLAADSPIVGCFRIALVKIGLQRSVPLSSGALKLVSERSERSAFRRSGAEAIFV